MAEPSNSLHADPFYPGVPVFRGFTSVMDPTLYKPLPDDWVIGLADIVQSTQAIAQNRYKAVNMAGAAVVAAVKNVLGSSPRERGAGGPRDIPFVFGGDGASFAVPPHVTDRVRIALAATGAWARDELDLAMRLAMVPVATVRAAGLDVRVARFAPSDNVTYAMFTGGGLTWAEAAMKRGEFAVPTAPPGTRPDLTGLFCRFEEIPARRGLILSLVIVPAGTDPTPFRALIEGVVAISEHGSERSCPVPPGGGPLHWPPTGAELEARARRGARTPLIVWRLAVLARTVLHHWTMRRKVRIGGFESETYLRQLVENSDFRKFDDGLRMTLDCPPALADAIEARLRDAAASGVARYGLYRQDAALITCFTPSASESNHMHFIDGAGGGYATAAALLKTRLQGDAPFAPSTMAS